MCCYALLLLYYYHYTTRDPEEPLEPLGPGPQRGGRKKLRQLLPLICVYRCIYIYIYTHIHIHIMILLIVVVVILIILAILLILVIKQRRPGGLRLAGGHSAVRSFRHPRKHKRVAGRSSRDPGLPLAWEKFASPGAGVGSGRRRELPDSYVRRL